MQSVTETAKVFKALGDPTRLKILREIACRKNHVCVMMIAETVGISQPAVSQHLRTLKNAGLVESERHGFHVHYSIKKDSLDKFGINSEEFFRSVTENVTNKESCFDTKNCLE